MGRATTTSLTEADALYRRLGELGAARRQIEETREQQEQDVGELLLEVRDDRHLSIGDAAELLGISRVTAYARMEETRQRRAREARRRRGRKGAGR